MFFCACMSAKLLQLCSTLRDTIDCSPPGSSVHGILQAGMGDCIAMLSLGDLPATGTNPQLLFLLHWQQGCFFTTSATWEAHSFSVVGLFSQVDSYRWLPEISKTMLLLGLGLACFCCCLASLFLKIRKKNETYIVFYSTGYLISGLFDLKLYYFPL